MIVCNKVVKEYNTGAKFRAVNDVSFHISKGEFAALIGQSGSGKSTIMNMIGLIDSLTKGEIIIDGVNICTLNSIELAQMRNKKIGYIFQSFYLEECYSVFKNIEIPLLIAGIGRAERKKRITECLEKVGLSKK